MLCNNVIKNLPLPAYSTDPKKLTFNCLLLYANLLSLFDGL